MNDSSPDASNDESSTETTEIGLSRLRWFLAGAAVGASIPITLAVYLFQQFSAYTATLPPGTAVCGMPLLLPWALLLIVAPILGLLGGGAGLLLVEIKQRKS
ncbi:hypothetical protein [Gimesia sp.]|uniref:hypothetical protein n=1 Tax=Gimesia sp. TaxID=2024833 RepID=UPI000C66DFB3|nr:hypothetical protein [Gimesia sp.]MAX37982.1 hypothetical protein [Gimesia sp.]HBL44963.1 hypothetical protein [Planctomycetaceae bacterium]|tara:strand:+ start:24741 stop:25046 length:306 start_codon:yes stop_codon:yes gene_type:complete